MRAWILDAPGKLDEGALRLGEMPDPEPGPGEILVDVAVCGLCRTDLHVVQGEIELPKLPVVPGHQVVGTVVRGGQRFQPGDRVGVAWLHETCGSCADCARGDENLCRSARYTGWTAHGGYAERVVVPEAFAYALPGSVPDLQVAPLLCAGIIGYRALRQADVKPGETVGLYGFGSSAHIAMQVARHWDCRVFVVTRGEAHRTLAREMGADWVGDSHEAPPEPMDRAVIFAPAGELIPQALESTRWGGTVASACIHMSPVPQMDYTRHLFGERTVRSTTANTRRDGEELLAIAATGAVETHVEAFAFEDCVEGLTAILEDRVQGSAVLKVQA
ncbi:MAG: zinc-dependent alcohol dehydrogenase family protein [Planctomycetota bacterium]|nr:zinc-dependent alcohol dehydrogenase family protein [Planctomycetota bacterium]